jgi:precorrin-2 dehydrogenase/sirohydrochlorin ferrochelatase
MKVDTQMEPKTTDEMRYYPVCLDVRGRACLVVGGGGVGTRKVKGLLSAGARVTVVSPELSPALEALTPEPVRWRRRSYRGEDLDGMFLVFGATDDEALNRRIYTDAGSRNVLCNIADRPESCSFILPSVVHRGDLLIAISTSGRSPAFAKKLRKDLESRFGKEYAEFLGLMGAIRERLLSAEHSPEAHKALFEALIEEGLAELVCRGDHAGADRLLERVLGPDFQLECLGKAP